MFRSPANALLRLSVLPISFLFWQQTFGSDLPAFGPMLLALLFCLCQRSPAPMMIIKIGIVLFISAWIQAYISQSLINNPMVYYGLLFVILYWCMHRARENPSDILSTLMLITLVLVSYFNRQLGIDVSQLPGQLFKELMLAGLLTYVGFILFPGGYMVAVAASQPHQQVHSEIWHLLLKALAIFTCLWGFISLDLSQSAIMSITLANVIKDPNPIGGKDYGRRRLLTTAVGFMFAMPPLVLAAIEVNLVIQYGISVVSAMAMGIYAFSRQASNNSLQLLYSGFVILLFKGISESGGDALYNDFIRLVAILTAVIIGLLVLILVQPNPVKANEHLK
ncbi:DUF2955 domain-containing protein [Shewanella sp. NIFS-20-20]|uniref:DUF2955 domain-containing protein n=1 Tax=Shewanella sp. NIFS-20-20 TaxID=2853806 RepID=UPI001C4680DF|nr:DUF2955 domain-containing protein [Shewanella sp. NIFS-20-20]MBV7314522.1 DUF2955 domain-containing protein [Shewanella sp. NIFS-20-20]